MKVYVVIDDEDLIMGIFSSYEKAEIYIQQEDIEEYCIIVEWTVDEPWKNSL